MTLRNSWPGPSGVTTTTDARIVLGGLIDDFAGGTPRTGVFPSNLNAIVTARTDMNVDIAAFAGVANQFGGPILIANDGTIQLPSVLVSPASGTNFYVIYVKQDESTSPGTDADNLPKAGSVLSTVSFAAARATLPTGALELATVQVPTGVSATNAGGVTITQTFPYTATEGGVVPVRNSTELAAWTPADGSLAWQIDLKVLWARSGGQWVTPSGSVPLTPSSVTGGTVNADGSISLSGVSSVSVDNIFTTVFRAFVIELDQTAASGNTNLQIVERSGGVDNTSTYFWNLIYSSGAGPSVAASTTGTTAQMTAVAATYRHLRIEIAQPAAASIRTIYSAIDASTDTLSMAQTQMAGWHGVTAAFDGFKISTLTGATINGSLRIYGLV